MNDIVYIKNNNVVSIKKRSNDKIDVHDNDFLTPRSTAARSARVVPPDLAKLQESTTLLFPADHSLVRLRTMGEAYGWLSVRKNGTVFGLRARDNGVNAARRASKKEPWYAQPRAEEREALLVDKDEAEQYRRDRQECGGRRSFGGANASQQRLQEMIDRIEEEEASDSSESSLEVLPPKRPPKKQPRGTSPTRGGYGGGKDKPAGANAKKCGICGRTNHTDAECFYRPGGEKGGAAGTEEKGGAEAEPQ